MIPWPPLLAGPGAIMAIIHQAERGDQHLGIALGLLGCCWCFPCRCVAGLLPRILRQAGIELVTRISGLLSVIAVQLVVDAIRELARRP